MSGLTRPDAGRVSVAGVDVSRSPARPGPGWAWPAETSLYPRLTVAEHLRLFGALAGLRRATLRRAVTSIAEQLCLTEVLYRPAGLLSGGQRKRTQAATALVAEAGAVARRAHRGADPRPAARCSPGSRTARPRAPRSSIPPTTSRNWLNSAPRWPWRGRAGSSPAAVSVRCWPGWPVRCGSASPGRCPPDCAASARRTDRGDGLRVVTSDAPAALARLLAAGAAPVSIDIRRPGLDDLDPALTP